MIQNLNNILHHELHNVGNTLSKTKYPEQDTEKLGKLVKIGTAYEDSPDEIFHPRYYNDSGVWRTNPTCPYYQILRYDKEQPYRFIGMDSNGRVIISDTREVDNFWYPPSGEEHLKDYPPLRFTGCRVLPMEKIAGSQSAFAKFFEKEEVRYYGVQDQRFFGYAVYTEYHQDIIGTKEKDVERSYEEPSVDYVRNQIKRLRAYYEFWPDFMIKQFRQYYNRFDPDKIGSQRRAGNTGFVIRADISGLHGTIVVAEFRENNEIAFVTNKEANFYMEIEDEMPTVMYPKTVSNILRGQTVCGGITLI